MRWLSRWKLDNPNGLATGCLSREGRTDAREEWEKIMIRQHPIRFFLQETLPQLLTFTIPWLIKETYWKVRHLTTDRYHILNISSKENKWSYGYSDIRERMLYASFALLVEFVEIESNDVCWEWNDDVLKVKVEMDLLYNWWKYERPNRNWTASNYGKFEEEDSNNLMRLAKIREYLWT